MINFRIIVSTQVHENYGAHDWDGKGQCPQYWKAKGGYEYRHPIALDLSEVQDRAKLQSLVDELTNAVIRNDNSFREHVIGWELLPLGELTHDEKNQLEWHGSVKHPTQAPRALAQKYAA
jgi:hypothetical protein